MKKDDDYSDMIDLPHHTSATRPHMSSSDRAAQFSPFAALKGYDEQIGETERLTHEKIILDEESEAAINQKLLLLKAREGERPAVRVTYFVPDERKAGGEYAQAEGRLIRVDAYGKKLLLEEGEIDFSEIFSVELL